MRKLTEAEERVVVVANLISCEKGILPICEPRQEIRQRLQEILDSDKKAWIKLQKSYEKVRKEIVVKMMEYDPNVSVVSSDVTQENVRLYLILEACRRLNFDPAGFETLSRVFR